MAVHQFHAFQSLDYIVPLQNYRSDEYINQILQWRAQRLAELTAPNGWLSMVGLHWLKPGRNQIGSAPENDIILRCGPAHLGVITLTPDARTYLQLAPSQSVSINGENCTQAELFDDRSAAKDDHNGQQASIVTFNTAQLFIIQRGDHKAVRIKDSAAVGRAQFAGLDYFTIEQNWRILADWVPFTVPHKLKLFHRLGTQSVVDVPGKAIFWRNDKMHTLLPFQRAPGGELFFVLADNTSGLKTYVHARFLYAEMPRANEIVLDFNKAHNPPSAFTPFANCPMAPAKNKLDLTINAGELRYRGQAVAA